jgi:hypothetical protein
MPNPLPAIAHMAPVVAVAGIPHCRSPGTRLPGVYLARQGDHDDLVYVGMAGERRGQGIKGRLIVYSRGKAAVSGLGEAALDRALAVQRH